MSCLYFINKLPPRILLNEKIKTPVYYMWDIRLKNTIWRLRLCFHI